MSDFENEKKRISVPRRSVEPTDDVREGRTNDEPEWSNLPPNPFQHDHGKPEQKPLDWRPAIATKAPPDPYTTKQCIVPIKPPADTNATTNRFRGPHPDNNRRQPGLTYERMGDPNEVARAGYWSAFRDATIQAHSTHKSIGLDVAAFTHAERDKELRALMFINPSDNKHNELDDHANTQQLPTRGGVTLGSLFDDKNMLILSKQESSSIDTLGRENQRGRHEARIEKADYGAVESDNQFETAYFSLKASVLHQKASAEGLRKASALLQAEVAAEEARGEQAEIERLKQEAAEVVEIVEGITSYVTMVAQFATGNVGDGIEQIGILAAKLVSHINDGKIAAAEQRLDAALTKKWQSRKFAAVAGLGEARSNFRAAQELVTSGEAAMRAKLTVRRVAYNKLGTTAAAELKAPKASRDRVAGMLAAIPVAEFVAARCAAIASQSDGPTYSEDAGRGFRMATSARLPEAAAFVDTVNELAFCKHYYGALERQWDRRVAQLHEIRRRIVGTRPGDVDSRH